MIIRPEIERLIAAIKSDKVHGASELARQSVQVLKAAAIRSQCNNAAQFRAEQREIGEKLISARPSMAPIGNIVRRLLLAVEQNRDDDIESIRNSTIICADDLMQASKQAVVQIIRHAVDLVVDGDVIITHSYSSTVESVLRAVIANYELKVIVTRSGPGRTGERLVRSLSEYNTPLIFIDDTALGLYVSQASKVLVGADRICVDGALVNGAGTCLLALAARQAGIPFYVLGESLKFDTRVSGSDVELEEKDPAEIVSPGTFPERVEVKNPYFDITPLEFITGIVTENGLIPQKDVLSFLLR